MSDFESLTEGLLINNNINVNANVIATPPKIENPFLDKPQEDVVIKPAVQKPIINQNRNATFFDPKAFQKELRAQSIKKNKSYHLASENITAYDIAGGCSRSVFYRINNVPAKYYGNKWLPVEMRCTIGTAVHDFIQDNCGVFTEQEVCLKVPSKRMSTRLDCLINDNVLVEIKSCNYTDMKEIIKTGRPRIKDFYQATLYKYLLENHLEEAKLQKPTRGGVSPGLDKYNIEYIQLVYVCHELVSGDSDSMDDAVKFAKNLKKLSGSKQDPFWFIQTVNVDLRNLDMSIYEKVVVDKMASIKKALDTNQLPTMDDKYIDKQACFFCLHGDICKSQP
jgi:hypothetical protein